MQDPIPSASIAYYIGQGVISVQHGTIVASDDANDSYPIDSYTLYISELVSSITYDDSTFIWTIFESDLSNAIDYTYGVTVEATSSETFSETFEYGITIIDPCFETVFTIDG